GVRLRLVFERPSVGLFFQAEDGIRDRNVTGVQTCALPILDALAALPDMPSGGVDIMMENFEDKNPAVIEINAFPMLQSTIYPTYGPSTDPQAYFLNSYYARDQFLNDVQDKYKIENENEYIRNYLLFQEKQKYFRNLIYKNAALNK